MPIKQLVCSMLIVSLMLSGCAARGSGFTSPQEISAADAKEESGSGFGTILLGALALAILVPIAILLSDTDGSDNDECGTPHKHRRCHHR